MRYYEVNRPSHAIQTFQKRKIFSGSCRNPALPPAPRRVTAGFGRVCSPLYVHLRGFEKQENLSQKTALEFGMGLARRCNRLGTGRARRRASLGHRGGQPQPARSPRVPEPAGMLCPHPPPCLRGAGEKGRAEGRAGTGQQGEFPQGENAFMVPDRQFFPLNVPGLAVQHSGAQR